jgi:hypothetical protein
MSDTDLDWTFDSIPAADEPPAVVPPRPQRPAPPRLRRAWPRWQLWALPALVIGGLLGVLVFTRLGWSRLQAQVRAEVVYEDERAAARDVAAVAAVQAPDYSLWLTQRTAEAGLGLPAPLPAPNLLPTGAPPRVVAFAARHDNVFAATVVRQYADSAGQTYDFELTQVYRSPGPGLWERLPSDDLALHNTTVFAGEHLTATFPVADLPWLSAALPQFEAALARACRAWHCPPGLRLDVVFGSQAHALSSVLRASRPAGPAYPIVFDLPPLSLSFPRRYRLPSPQLTGYPHDEPAAAALTRATTVQLLAALAGELAGERGGARRRSPDYFLDALVAREEIRQGLSPASVAAFPPYDYVAPSTLWQIVGQGALGAATDSLAFRRQALGFVDFALAGQPSSVDADLLRALRQHNTPARWLADTLSTDAPEVQARWRAAALAPWSAVPQPAYDGLVLVCEQNALVLGAGGLQAISARPQGNQFLAAHRSPDGRLLASLVVGRSTTKLVLFDLVDGGLQPLPVAQPGLLLGWQPTGELLYLEVHPANGGSNFWRLMRLRQYDPATGVYATLLDDPVVLPWTEAAVWSPDRRLLSFALYPRGPSQAPNPRLALVAPGTGPQVGLRLLPTSGYAPAFSPAGDRLAVFSGGDPFVGLSAAGDWRLNLLDWQHNQVTTLLTGGELGEYHDSQVGALAWSADARWLSFMALGGGGPLAAFLVSTDGGAARLLEVGARTAGSYPLGFSADSAYVAVQVFGGIVGTNEVVVFDLAAPPGTPPRRYLAHTAAWSPQGHDLILGGPAGVFAVDPATDAFHWLYDSPCAVEFAP